MMYAKFDKAIELMPYYCINDCANMVSDTFEEYVKVFEFLILFRNQY